MHKLMTAAASQNDRSRFDKALNVRRSDFEREAEKLKQIGRWSAAAEAFRGASARQNILTNTGEIHPSAEATSPICCDARDLLELRAQYAQRTQCAEALCQATRSPGIQAPAATPNLPATPSASAPTLDLDHASWEETAAFTEGLRAEAERLYDEAIGKLQQVQSIWVQVAHLRRFDVGQSDLAHAFAQQCSTQTLVQRRAFDRVRQEASNSMLHAYSFGESKSSDENDGDENPLGSAVDTTSESSHEGFVVLK